MSAGGNKCPCLLRSLERVVLVVKLLDDALFTFQLIKARLDLILLKDCEYFVNVDEICQINHIDQAHVLIRCKCFSVCAQEAPEQPE